MIVLLTLISVLLLTMSGVGMFIFQFLLITFIELLGLLFSGFIGMIIVGLFIGWILEKRNV